MLDCGRADVTVTTLVITAAVVVCGVTTGDSTETRVLATVAKAPVDEACGALTVKIVDTVGAETASEMDGNPELTRMDSPDWDDATDGIPVSLEAIVVEAKLEGTKRDETSVTDEDRDASVAEEEET